MSAFSAKIDRREDGSKVIRIPAAPKVDLSPLEARLAKLESSPVDGEMASRLSKLERLVVSQQADLMRARDDLTAANAAAVVEAQARAQADQARAEKHAADLAALRSSLATEIRAETMGAVQRSQAEIAATLAAHAAQTGAQLASVSRSIEAAMRETTQSSAAASARALEGVAAVQGAVERIGAPSAGPVRFAVERGTDGRIVSVTRQNAEGTVI